MRVEAHIDPHAGVVGLGVSQPVCGLIGHRLAIISLWARGLRALHRHRPRTGLPPARPHWDRHCAI